MTPRPSRSTAGRRNDPALQRGIIALGSLALVLIAAIGADAFRIGFFADDFHFLDVARGNSILALLSGQHGMWPWFRPLSRELYFKLVVGAGSSALPLAHALSLACLFGSTVLLWRIGRRLVGPAPAAVAALWFLTYDFTKFLAAWPSGFQDLLALILVLMALDAHQRQRIWLSFGCAFLAPFAKEVGFLAIPLLFTHVVVCEGHRPNRWWTVRLLSAGAIAVGVHVIARMTWQTAGGTERLGLAPERLPVILLQALQAFIGSRPSGAAGAAWLALLAGAGAAVWLWAAAAPNGKRPEPTAGQWPSRGRSFVIVAAVIGVAPVVVGHLLSLTYAHAYHVFPAVPWIALLLSDAITRISRSAWRFAVPLLVAWNVWALGFDPPDLERPEDWAFHRWDWHEAVRFSAVTHRLSDDVRRELATRPDSLVVLYEGMPPGAFFQTQDGPATREVLRDRSVRAFWINDPPSEVTTDRLAILTFDPERLRLVRARWSSSTAVFRSMNAIMANHPRAANAFALYDESPDSARFDRTYLRAAAALLENGPDGFMRILGAGGLGDTLGTAPDSLARPLEAADRGLGTALAGMLHHPLNAATHVALADSLLRRGVLPRGGLELRLAVTLEPNRLSDRYRLAVIMAQLGGSDEAVLDLQEIANDPAAGALAGEARTMMQRLLSR